HKVSCSRFRAACAIDTNNPPTARLHHTGGPQSSAPGPYGPPGGLLAEGGPRADAHSRSIRTGVLYQRIPHTVPPRLGFMRLRGRPSQGGVRGPANDRAYTPVVEGGFRSPDVARGEDELARLDAAIQQLERAELYVAAALEVGLEDPFRRRVL